MQTTDALTHPGGSDADEPATRMLEETLELIDFVPVAGPPAVTLVAPLVLFALALAGPFLVLLTIGALMIAVVALLALAGAVVISPYLLVRHVRGHRASPRPASLPRTSTARFG